MWVDEEKSVDPLQHVYELFYEYLSPFALFQVFVKDGFHWESKTAIWADDASKDNLFQVVFFVYAYTHIKHVLSLSCHHCPNTHILYNMGGTGGGGGTPSTPTVAAGDHPEGHMMYKKQIWEIYSITATVLLLCLLSRNNYQAKWLVCVAYLTVSDSDYVLLTLSW